MCQPQFAYHHIHVPDYGVPTDAQIDRFVTLMDQHHAAGEAVVSPPCGGLRKDGAVHRGLVRQGGVHPADTDPVPWIRARRKCCLETREQTACAQRWMKKLGASLKEEG